MGKNEDLEIKDNYWCSGSVVYTQSFLMCLYRLMNNLQRFHSVKQYPHSSYRYSYTHSFFHVSIYLLIIIMQFFWVFQLFNSYTHSFFYVSISLDYNYAVFLSFGPHSNYSVIAISIWPTLSFMCLSISNMKMLIIIVIKWLKAELVLALKRNRNMYGRHH